MSIIFSEMIQEQNRAGLFSLLPSGCLIHLQGYSKIQAFSEIT